MRVNQCKALTLHLSQCYLNNHSQISGSLEAAHNKLVTVGNMTSACKPGKSLINVLFQQAVRKRIQRPADTCTGKRFLICNVSLFQKQEMSLDAATESQS